MPQHRNSLLCPNCRRLISRDIARCPHCGLRRPGAWWKNTPLFAGFSDNYGLIKLIIYVNIGMYILSLLISSRGVSLNPNPFRFLSPDNRSLLVLGATGTIPIIQFHNWWSLIAANYLHGGLMHILFNMIALWEIGPLAVSEYGSYRTFAIYTIGGVGGFFLSFLAGVSLTIGASAAICALLGAILYYGKSRGGTYGRLVFRQVGGWAIAIFVFGLLIPGINNWGHGGGIAAGALIGYLLGYTERRAENIRHKILAVSCAVLTVLVLIGALLNGLRLFMA